MLPKRLFYIACLLLAAGVVHTQGIDAAEVSITSEDKVKLYGTYYAPSTDDSPAVLLLHQLYTTRTSWQPLIDPLLNTGYKVLVVDLRGYGASRGKINWTAAQQDTLDWAAWLDSQLGVTSVMMIGSSMGSSLALNGCASYNGCAGAIALSPGLNYFGVSTTDAISGDMNKLIVYADRDGYPARDVPKMLELGGSNLEVHTYAGRDHGIDLLRQHDDLIPLMVAWLQQRG